MATLDATIGGASSNAYLGVAEADAYFETRFGSGAWEALSDDDKAKALMHATRDLDKQRYKGLKLYAVQFLQFPRDSQRHPEWAIIPQAVRDACCEQALHIAANSATGGQSRQQSLAASGVTLFQVGDHIEQYSQAAQGGRAQRVLCSAAQASLVQWISNTGQVVLDQEGSGYRDFWPILPLGVTY